MNSSTNIDQKSPNAMPDMAIPIASAATLSRDLAVIRLRNPGAL
jgi:hypothetical protein